MTKGCHTNVVRSRFAKTNGHKENLSGMELLSLKESNAWQSLGTCSVLPHVYHVSLAAWHQKRRIFKIKLGGHLCVHVYMSVCKG